MTKEEQKVQEALRRMIGVRSALECGKVLEVDEEKSTCKVQLIGGGERYGVRLKATIDSNTSGAIMIPKVGAMVIIQNILNTNDHLVVMFDELEKILWKLGNMTLEVSADGFVFNGGTLKGMTKIDAVVSKLNDLENKVNDLVTYSATHVHPGVTTGPGSTGVSASPVVGALPVTVVADLENDKVKQ